MVLFPDFRDLLAAFDASAVRYLLVGGYAVIFHGRPRATKDIDLLVALDDGNLERLAGALADFGAAPNVVAGARRLDASEILYFGSAPLRVDILGSASGIEFEAVFARAVLANLDGVPVRVIALDDLIANKQASGRPRDLDDCRELSRVASRKKARE